MTTLRFRDQDFQQVSMDNLTPGEAAAVEGVTGLTFQKIRRLASLCVCEHSAVDHEDEGDNPCKSCGCAEFEADMPVVVSTALVWVSIKRADRSVKFADVSDTPYSQMVVVDDEDAAESAGEPDPTEPPQEAA